MINAPTRFNNKTNEKKKKQTFKEFNGNEKYIKK